MFQRDQPSEYQTICAPNSNVHYAQPVETPIDSAMKSTHSRRSFMTSLFSFSISLLTAVYGHPQQCQSSSTFKFSIPIYNC